ncbi:hypothetical protein JXC34_04740 [Candidatus Woesearchaeota archaeon]|nr:hypothetical protein [Candidatus Woesearchaeota archaeon]
MKQLRGMLSPLTFTRKEYANPRTYDFIEDLMSQGIPVSCIGWSCYGAGVLPEGMYSSNRPVPLYHERTFAVATPSSSTCRVLALFNGTIGLAHIPRIQRLPDKRLVEPEKSPIRYLEYMIKDMGHNPDYPVNEDIDAIIVGGANIGEIILACRLKQIPVADKYNQGDENEGYLSKDVVLLSSGELFIFLENQKEPILKHFKSH